MMRTEGVLIYKNGNPEVLEWSSWELSELAPDEVQIRQYAIGVNFIDIYFCSGLYQHPLPHGLGFEAAGEVVAVGKDVTHLKLGDRVAYAQGAIGAYTQMRNMPAQHLIKLPDAISFEQAAASLLKGLTIQYLFRQTYAVQPGQTILFHAAAGGVGLFACQLAKHLQVKLIGVVSTPEKAEAILSAGAWKAIVTSKENVVDKVKDFTNGAKVPVVYDSVGKDTWETSLNCLQPRGLMVSFGNASGAVSNIDLGILAQKGSLYVTRPTLGTYTSTYEATQSAADELFGWMQSGALTPAINAVYPLKDAAAAHQALLSRQTTGSIILTP